MLSCERMQAVIRGWKLPFPLLPEGTQRWLDPSTSTPFVRFDITYDMQPATIIDEWFLLAAEGMEITQGKTWFLRPAVPELRRPGRQPWSGRLW